MKSNTYFNFRYSALWESDPLCCGYKAQSQLRYFFNVLVTYIMSKKYFKLVSRQHAQLFIFHFDVGHKFYVCYNYHFFLECQKQPCIGHWLFLLCKRPVQQSGSQSVCKRYLAMWLPLKNNKTRFRLSSFTFITFYDFRKSTKYTFYLHRIQLLHNILKVFDVTKHYSCGIEWLRWFLFLYNLKN